jgi:hypothetical protein
MVEVDLSSPVLAKLEQTEAPVKPTVPRWELVICSGAALAVMVVIATVLLILTAELRAGWVPGHELPMDKTQAIHHLFFRP